ncbi:MAG: UMP kinase [Bacilli bacterium]|jgi:uridylate kinase|nr:UMP kinase [Bacilli bacterium]
MKTIYQTIVLKLSGEALADGNDKTILDAKKLKAVAAIVEKVEGMGVHVAVVVGAGNIYRGRLSEKIGIERSTGDYMGMLGTIINALALQSAFEEKGLSTRVMSSINVPQVCEPYIRRKAIHHLKNDRVVIFAGGTGNPYFTTDTTATLRAREIGAEAILMAKNGIEGVYDDDPRKNKNAKLLPKLTYREVIERKLGVMDLTAVALLEDSDIKINVFDMEDPENIAKVLMGEKIGTVISKE